MTQRLYYDDAYTTHFTARVVERLTVDDQPALVLDRTCFYPSGGGQPADRGTINQVEVADVIARQSDGAVLHLLSAEVQADQVTCRVDWERRVDHMQHHTGQHILSAAFVVEAGANTVGFHLGSESVTIDLDKSHIPPATLDRVEDLANQVVREDRPVRAWFPTGAELDEMHLRGVPLLDGPLRVVEIEGFDCNACGGTHVARTGEIGLIKIIRLDRRGEETRVEFLCGNRALLDYRRKNAMVNRLAAELTVGHWELDQAIARLRAENQRLHSDLKAARAQLLDGEAADLLESSPERNGLRVIKRAYAHHDRDEIRKLASSLAKTPGVVALLGLAGQDAQLVFARADDVERDMVPLLKRALHVLGSKRGGGRANFAQGGGVPADLSLVESALNEAESVLLGSRT
jgi:alanyl-tRNA synthetase